jgi:carboxyl-terminal processing protease
MRIIYSSFVICGLLALGLATAFSFKSLPSYAEDRYAEFQNFAKVLNLIQKYYVEEVDTKKLVYGAIKGMLRELDPHTNFLPPEIFKEFETETSGEFGGIGIEISVQEGVLTIISPIEDTPAWNAGIQAGDKIIAIDGTSTKGLSLAESSQLMKGKSGETISLTIVRADKDEPINYNIVRGNVKIRSVKYTDLNDGFAYIRITNFIENTSKDLEKFLDEHAHKKSPNNQARGLILDLRRNPGGLLDQAIKVSDLFLSSGTIVSTIGRNKDDKEVNVATKKDSDYVGFPLIILMNEYSASASEIVAGALRDNKRALIMGEKSFGKGSVQSVIKLGDGSGLKLTVARYYTPSGVSIQAEGITPDVELQDVDSEAFDKVLVKTQGLREKDMVGHLKGDRETKDKNANNGFKKAVAVGDKKDPSAWWKDAKKPEEKSPKEKLLSTDYQVLQAFNYIKAWSAIRDLGDGKGDIKAALKKTNETVN